MSHRVCLGLVLPRRRLDDQQRSSVPRGPLLPGPGHEDPVPRGQVRQRGPHGPDDGGRSLPERVLDRLGLADPGAEDDLDELRELLRAWRDAKASAWKAAVDWLVRGVFALLLVGIAVRLGVGEMVR